MAQLADWDPLGEPEEGASAMEAMMGSPDDVIPIEGSDVKITRKDMGRTFTDLERKLFRESPWRSLPDPLPDLSWHKPTCTLEQWKHADVKVQLGTCIAHVTLNRPAENNVLNEGMVAALCDVLFLLQSRQDIRVVVFTGEGKMFSSGRDPKGDPFGFSVKSDGKSVAEAAEEALKGGAFPSGKINAGRLLQAKFWHTWATLPQFTICVANGSAMGDGMGPLVCSDMVIALKTSFFGFSDTKFGIVNAALSPYVLAKTSAGAAKNMFVMGQVLSAEAAHEKGFVNRVVDSLADAHKVVETVCGDVSQCGPRSVQLAKELVQGVSGRQVDDQIIFYTVAFAERAAASEEAAQSAKAAVDAKPKPWETSRIQPVS